MSRPIRPGQTRHRIAAIESDPMAPRPLVAFALVLVLAPVIPPLPAETVRQTESGDAAAQFKLAEHYLVAEPDDPERMLGWLREFARRGYLLA